MPWAKVFVVVAAFSVAAIPRGDCATYVLDEASPAKNGDGSESEPFRTWPQARKALKAGDTLLIRNGSYGAILEGIGARDIFSDWVTIRGAGDNVVFDSVEFGERKAKYFGEANEGVYDAFMKFENLKIREGVTVIGAKNLEFANCRITQVPPYIGSAENIGKTAVRISSGTNVILDGCEITDTALGINAAGLNITIRNCDIHDITHDGIRCVGLVSSLIEGNRIHGLDDGVSDAEASWSRHCDAIHVFIPGSPKKEALKPNRDVTIRGNVIYDIESQGVQFNNYKRFPDVRNSNFLFENNIFGPTGAIALNNAEPVDGLVIRHNSFITGRREYTSPKTESGRTIVCENSMLRITPETTKLAVYNNILGPTPAVPDTADFFDYNLIQQPKKGSPLRRFTVVAERPVFADRLALDARLASRSQAIDAGTRVFATPALSPDIVGTERDARPDMGAFEIPDRTPAAEPTPEPRTDRPETYVDDFEDANLREDPFLAGGDKVGLSWVESHGGDVTFGFAETGASHTQLKAPGKGGVASVIRTVEGRDWADYQFEFTATNKFVTQGAGAVILGDAGGEGYWIDLGRDEGGVYRRMSVGEKMKETRLGSTKALGLPHNGSKRYTVHVAHESDANVLTIYVDGVKAATIRDKDAAAIDRLRAGGVGFWKASKADHHTVLFDDVKVTVSRRAEGD